jgi:hypothetical protein
MRSKFKTISGLVAIALLILGVVVAASYPVSSKEDSTRKDPPNGLAAPHVGL